MATFSKERIAALVAADKKSSYIRRTWTTREEDCMTPQVFGELINPIYKHVDASKNPVIIAKGRKDGGFFCKMAIFLEGGAMSEYDLSYEDNNNTFEEGDEIDVSTLKFCVETWLDNTHLYATGKII